VLVDPATGHERLGEQLTGRDRAWLDTWWPIQSPGDRAEIGWPRDAAWAEAVSSLRRGIAVAADYEHRSAARPAGGSLAGYRDGHRVPPVPDGSCDITSHVALDACADAGRRAGARWTVHTTQRETLRALGIARPSPPYDVARSDPARYLAELSRGSQVAELTRAGGLGDFGWLVQGVALDPPDVLSSLLGDTPRDPGLGNS
jgi:SAM-dependent MidA family methyltransferase